jgi:ethanolamine utilization protein EutA
MPNRVDDGKLVSVGIDVGTTSTHLTVSHLFLSNCSRPNQAPRLAISERRIVYRSAIHFTPVTQGAIDAQAVREIVESEYHAAGINPENIETGAVIITGETAKLRNAPSVTHALAEMAGSFVVASAGPNLEGILAGRGSGAADASAATGRTICNIDVGGGTANIAVFADGEPVDVACLAVGGRLMTLAPDGLLTGLSDSGELLLDATNKNIPIGSVVSQEMLELIGNLIAEALIQYIVKRRPPQIAERLLVSDSLRRSHKIDQFWLSGGVAELIKRPPADPLLYGDIGSYIAQGIKGSLDERSLPFHIPDEPIRATVIGAAMHSAQLSGSTIAVQSSNLPLRNVPIVRPFQSIDSMDAGVDVNSLLRNCFDRLDLDWSTNAVAIVMGKLPETDFASLQRWAGALSEAFIALKGSPPLILLTRDDIAMAFGQLLRTHLPDQQLVILDGIDSTNGDYIDIGKPISNGNALPVVVKSLIFS